MLPTRIDGLDVGGDWYDAFVLDDDRIALVVGDVVGRGLHAAAAMGQLRSAVRALAMADSGPAELLERLDRFVEGVAAANTATMVYAEVDLRDGSVVFACAGHPPPVLVDGPGRSALLWEGRSAPLGVQLGIGPRPEATITLTAGSRLVLYTDGLVERRDQPLDLSIDLLAEQLEAWAEWPVAGLADGVADALLGTGPPATTSVSWPSPSAGPPSGDAPSPSAHGRSQRAGYLRSALAVGGFSEAIMVAMTPSRAVTRRHLPSSPFSAPVARPVELFAVNDRVTHDRYGLGSVVGIEQEVAVLVDFGIQRVRITTPYTKLNKL